MSEAIGQKLKAARLAAGYRTAKQFADTHGIPQPTYALHEAGKRGLTRKRAEHYARLLDVRTEWLWTEEDDIPVGDNFSPGPAIRQYLPVISWVQAGAWAEVQEPIDPEDCELVPVFKHYSKHAFALRLNGDSMQAPDGVSFPTGSIICVEPEMRADNGSFVVARRENDNEATFKQLIIDGDRKYLKPLNPRYPIILIDEPIVFCGVVRQLVMNFE